MTDVFIPIEYLLELNNLKQVFDNNKMIRNLSRLSQYFSESQSNISLVKLVMEQAKNNMQYRFLGPTGIKVSVISYGNWLNSNSPQAKQLTIDCVKTSWDLGINFFDTAEVYGYGQAQRQIGVALRQLKVPRHHFVLTTKIYWGQKDQIPNTRGLSRKHIIEGMRKSLANLGFPYVDVVFCHRPDYQTPMVQTCRAFDWLIRKGWAYYWGTSEWNSEDIAQANMICDRYGLIKPVVQQPQYNLFVRDKIERDFRRSFEKKRLGTTVWSPLLGGVLTGKYNDGIPEGSRVDTTDFKYKLFLEDKKEKTMKSLKEFKVLADELGCSMAQLAMAWVINNPDVSTAITGATKTQQLIDTIKALQVRKKFDRNLQERIQKIFDTAPEQKLDIATFAPQKSRRFQALGYI